MPFTVYIAHEDSVARDMMRRALVKIRNMTLVGTAVDGLQAAFDVSKLSPDILLMDITLPKMNGLELAKWVKNGSPLTKVVFVTQHDELTYRTVADLLSVDGFVKTHRILQDLPDLLSAFDRSIVKTADPMNSVNMGIPTL